VGLLVLLAEEEGNNLVLSRETNGESSKVRGVGRQVLGVGRQGRRLLRPCLLFGSNGKVLPNLHEQGVWAERRKRGVRERSVCDFSGGQESAEGERKQEMPGYTG
jgi:hypothetical protein